MIRTVELGRPAATVWDVIGGFFTIHDWHPDITADGDPADQTTTRQLRRLLTFPGQPKTTEELISMDNDDYHYRYQWHAGAWGEAGQGLPRPRCGCLTATSGGRASSSGPSTFVYPDGRDQRLLRERLPPSAGAIPARANKE